MSKKLTVFAKANPEPSFDNPRPDRVLAGNPNRTTWELYDFSGLSAGIWACEVGSWKIAFPEDKDEYFYVLEGRLAIINTNGEREEFGPGQACVIPASFTGVFEVIEPVKKHFVVMDRSAI